jgi:phytoene dehydrogenase-like protein
MKRYKDISFLEFMRSHGTTNKTILDVMQSAVYMAAGVGIDRASAYEALRTLKDTDKESSKMSSIKKLIFGLGIEYDEGVAVGGMSGLVDRVMAAIDGNYVLNCPVESITEENGSVCGLSFAGREIEHSLVVSDIPLWSMPKTVKSTRPAVSQFFERWSHMEVTRGLTLWLGLDRVVIGDRKSRVIVHPEPNRWMLSLSSFDPTCAPSGKELVAVATVLDPQVPVTDQVASLKGNGLGEYVPGLLDNIEMEHVQATYATRAALIPGQTDLDRPGPETPISGLYIVGTDTAGSGVGLQQAASSAEGAVKALRSVLRR